MNSAESSSSSAIPRPSSSNNFDPMNNQNIMSNINHAGSSLLLPSNTNSSTIRPDFSDFPALGLGGGNAAVVGGNRTNPPSSTSNAAVVPGQQQSMAQQFGQRTMAALLQGRSTQQTQSQLAQSGFQLQKEDFPALGARIPKETASVSSGQAAHSQHSQQSLIDTRQLSQQPSGNDGGFEFQQQQHQAQFHQLPPQQQAQINPQVSAQQQQQQARVKSTDTRGISAADRFGLIGLLGVIRMTDQDLNTLALGCDLTTLGLDLNATEELYPSFLSPWPEQPSDISPNCIVPSCYQVQAVPQPIVKIANFSEETLFYIFYCMPRDELQEYAADELYRRNWRYHKDLKLWLTKEPNVPDIVYTPTSQYEKGIYIFWDIQHWCRVSKEFVVYYEMLETRQPPPPVPAGPSTTNPILR